MSSTAHKQTAPPDESGDIYDDGYLRVEYSNYYVSCGGREISLSRKEFLIISQLVREYGRAVAFADIWAHAWGENVPYNRGTLRVQMHRVRRLLAPFGLRVESETEVGYALRVPLKD
ncbi:MAG TPA: helix-turn-helix domain-containing protein [Pyrinomonadaceae bacterium]